VWYFKSVIVTILGLFCALSAGVSVDVKVDEQVMAPAGWIGAAVSAHGVHVAVLALKGSRNVVLIDGVEGPIFDQLLEGGGRTYNRPLNVDLAIWPPKSGPIAFSEDGAHCACFGKVGDQYVTVLDGKEINRGAFGSILRNLSFSTNGKHVFYIESDTGGSHCRVMMDGKPEPWSHQSPSVVFSADGEHYAYSGTQPDAAKTPWSVVDGRQVQYFGDNLQFTATGHLLSVFHSNGLDTLMLDNKPVMRATKVGPVWVSPTGNQVAAVMLSKPGAPTFLTMNGKPIPGTEGAVVKHVYFSPDGKRYAAHCKSTTYTEFMVIDGKKGQEYLGISPGDYDASRDMGPSSMIHGYFYGALRPTFMADSSKLVYMAQASSRWFVVINGEESDAYGWLMPPVIASNARVGYSIGDGSGLRYDTVVDGKVVSTSSTRGLNAIAFSPGGARYATLGGVLNSINRTLAVDGADVPGVAIFGVSGDEKQFPYFLFSPDDKHIAYFGTDMPNHRQHGLWIDQKLVFPTDGVDRLQFTADSQHLLSVDRNLRGVNTLYVDGRPSVQFRMSAFDAVLEAREIASNGVLTLLTVKDGALVRYRVTPPSDTSLATLVRDPSAGR